MAAAAEAAAAAAGTRCSQPRTYMYDRLRVTTAARGCYCFIKPEAPSVDRVRTMAHYLS